MCHSLKNGGFQGRLGAVRPQLLDAFPRRFEVRTSVLPSVCVTSLGRHRESQRLERQMAAKRWHEMRFVFTSTVGTPIDDGNALREFDAVVKAAGLPKQRFPDLRHTAITLLGAQGVPLKVIADIVGHSDIRLTQNVYQHVFQPARCETPDKTNELSIEATGGEEKSGLATAFATVGQAGPVN